MQLFFCRPHKPCGGVTMWVKSSIICISVLNRVLKCVLYLPLVGWRTRVSSTTFTIIDQVFINFHSNGCCCVLDNISDHRTIFIELDLNITTNNNKTSFNRTFSEADDWLQIFSSSDFQQEFQSFYSSLLYYFGISFLKRKSFAKPDKKNWINNAVIKSSRYLDIFVMKNNYPELVPAYEQVKRKHSGLVKRTK
nr:unnamed protein product [Callosobruchus analis]